LFVESPKLNEIPPEIHNLQRSLPMSLTQMKKLHYLYLNQCKLAEIPPVVGKIPHLGRLYLEDNRLEDFQLP